MEARDLILSPSLSELEIRNILKPFGIRDTQAADLHIQQIVESTRAPERVAGFIAELLLCVRDSVDPDAALSNFVSFLEASPSPLNLISHLHADPKTADLLIGVLGASPYLSQILIRNPEYIYWLAERNRMERIRDSGYFQEQASIAVQPFDTLSEAVNALRRYKRRESLRIGSQDLLGYSTMTQTVSQVSSLADSILQKTFEVLARERLKSLNGFLVVALGKLGGQELNFSSDIDILFLFEEDDRKREMHKFAREYARTLSEYSAEGHLYRVDLRLRPMGSHGEIAYSEKAMSNYFQTWADTTDRLALIKCRAVAGDRRMGQRFENFAADFVFKKFHDHAAVEEIRWIKKRTDEEIQKKPGTGQNIKLGLGGIREIEFFVQSFQILYGGLQPEIRTRNTLPGLQKLLDFGYISSSDYDELAGAYVFLRNLEHKLQLVHDLQTHSLPEEQHELEKCARRMGYRDESQEISILQTFTRDLEIHNKNVRRIFDSLFEEGREQGGLGQIALNPRLPDEEAIQILRESGVKDPKSLLEGIRLLQQAPAFPHSPARIRNLLANLIPVMIENTAEVENTRDLITRLDRFAENLGSRAGLYTELVENQQFAYNLFLLLASGEFLSERLIRHPEFIDYVSSPSESSEFRSDLSQMLVAAEDVQSFMDSLRHFKHREEFKIGVKVLLNPKNLSHRSELSQVADSILETALKKALDGTELESESFCLYALGKLGGSELTFHSDLDLLFILDDTVAESRAADFEPVLKRFREFLFSYTARGRAYEVDFRLRPEGTHATEVVTVSQIKNYFSSRLEAWERLAYTKNRPVFHSPGFRDEDLLNQLVFSASFNQQEKEQIRTIRKRKEVEIGKEKQSGDYDFKVGQGALLDIQFAVQYSQIQHEVIEPNTLISMNKLRDIGILKTDVADFLEDALRFYYSLESLVGLLGNGERKLSSDPGECNFLAHLMGFGSGQDLLEKYRLISKQVRSCYDEILS